MPLSGGVERIEPRTSKKEAGQQGVAALIGGLLHGMAESAMKRRLADAQMKLHQAQLEATKAYHEAQIEARGASLAERTRHNKAMEEDTDEYGMPFSQDLLAMSGGGRMTDATKKLAPVADQLRGLKNKGYGPDRSDEAFDEMNAPPSKPLRVKMDAFAQGALQDYPGGKRFKPDTVGQEALISWDELDHIKTKAADHLDGNPEALKKWGRISSQYEPLPQKLGFGPGHVKHWLNRLEELDQRRGSARSPTSRPASQPAPGPQGAQGPPQAPPQPGDDLLMHRKQLEHMISFGTPQEKELAAKEYRSSWDPTLPPTQPEFDAMNGLGGGAGGPPSYGQHPADALATRTPQSRPSPASQPSQEPFDPGAYFGGGGR